MKMTNLPLPLFIITIIIFFSTLYSFSSAEFDTLTAAQPLADGETLISENGSFALGFFSPDNSNDRYVGIWYNKVSVQTVVWVANRKAPVSDSQGILSITANGTLLITNNNSTVFWSLASPTPTPRLNSTVAQLLDNGNFVLKEADSSSSNPSSFAWQSFDHPTDTLLPGMKLGQNLTSGLIRNLTAWTSTSDPAPSDYTMAMDLHGYPQVFLWSGSGREWRGGPWNGIRFTGIPEMLSYTTMFSFEFVSNSEEVSYSFYITEPSVISRLIVNQSGITQRLIWIEESKVWNAFWFAPKDQCDNISPCGPYGICDPNAWPICSCPQGFQPKNPTNWALRDGSEGCVRKTALDCWNRTDGFLLVRGAKLPDTSSSWSDMSMTLEQCRVRCLSNCSCTAYASANISSGIGCIIWTVNLTDMRVYTNGGQDLYIRLAAADLGKESKHAKWSTVAAALVGCVLGILVLLLIGFCVKKKRKQRRRRTITTTITGDLSRSMSSSRQNRVDQISDSKNLDLPLYDLTTIVHATHNFAMENKLGEGGFGPVYKGKLGDGQEIAVKRLAKTSVQGIDEFKNEVMLIAKLQHRNLVRLLGCCVQEEERMLIYEFMDNKSLDVFLFDKAKRWHLDWQTRYNIIIGIARGLLYLHQDSRFRIIHRDLKTSNILLDKDMKPKISDFGLARIFGGDETEVNTKRVVGTYGYMSPEYAMDGVFSIKSDVFSFGVLVLEIISGKKNRGVYLNERHENLLGYAWSLWQEGHGLELADTSIGEAYPMTEVLRCLKVGLLCVQERPDDRPTMSAVVFMLGSESSYVPHPKPPGFIATKGPLETDSSSSKQTGHSLNEISLTMFQGR